MWLILAFITWYLYHAYNVLYGDPIYDPPFFVCICVLPIIFASLILEIISSNKIGGNSIKAKLDKILGIK